MVESIEEEFISHLTYTAKSDHLFLLDKHTEIQCLGLMSWHDNDVVVFSFCLIEELLIASH